MDGLAERTDLQDSGMGWLAERTDLEAFPTEGEVVDIF